jgi:hypothetical protein
MMVELGDLPDDLANMLFEHISAQEADNVPIVDSGVSHDLCGNFQIFSNFRPFVCPIPLKVATRNGSTYITGKGNLTFYGADNQMVTIYDILYCELARSTLISLVALRKANARFA